MTAKQVIYPKAYSIHKTEGVNFGHLCSMQDETVVTLKRYRFVGSDAVCVAEIYQSFEETYYYHLQVQDRLIHS
jgi:hypothetical protein